MLCFTRQFQSRNRGVFNAEIGRILLVLCERFCDNKGALFNDVQLSSPFFQSVFLISIINGVPHIIKDEFYLFISVKKTTTNFIETLYE